MRAKKRPAKASKPDDIKKPLGIRVRELRELAGMSQRELAHASGISGVFLGTVERGEKAATVESIEKIAAGLRREPYELFQFGLTLNPSTVAERLARKVAALARGADERKAARFERIAKAFFEEDA